MPSSANKTLAFRATQVVFKTRDLAAVAGGATARESELRKLDALWSVRSTPDGSGLLTAVSEWIGQEETTLDIAWVWLTEPALRGASPKHARSSRLHTLMGNMLASSPNGAGLAPKLAPFSNARGFHPLQPIATATGPQVLMSVLVNFGFLGLADQWLDFAEPNQWDMDWVDAAVAVVQSKSHDDHSGAASFLRRLREEQNYRLFAGLPLSEPAQFSRPARLSRSIGGEHPDRLRRGSDDDFDHEGDDAELNEAMDCALYDLSKEWLVGESTPKAATPIDKHGAFLATYGALLIEEWEASQACIGHAAFTALAKIKKAKLATAQQAWGWILEQSFQFGGDRSLPKQSLAQTLVAQDHEAITGAGSIVGRVLVQQHEAEVWPWLETAECFHPMGPLEANGLSMVALALRAPSHMKLAERWVRNMAHESVDAHWAPLAEILTVKANPDLPAFVDTVKRSVERHALAATVREAEKTGAANANPSLPDSELDATGSVSRPAPRL